MCLSVRVLPGKRGLLAPAPLFACVEAPLSPTIDSLRTTFPHLTLPYGSNFDCHASLSGMYISKELVQGWILTSGRKVGGGRLQEGVNTDGLGASGSPRPS